MKVSDDFIEKCAIAAHSINRMYCVFLDDESQVAWPDAPEWQKHSARQGVRAILEEGVDSEESHRRWMELKKKEGWKYGPVKDPEKKRHPCMMQYHLLPTAQLVKDSIFGAVVRGIAAHYQDKND